MESPNFIGNFLQKNKYVDATQIYIPLWELNGVIEDIVLFQS